jgi:hypothetical protein
MIGALLLIMAACGRHYCKTPATGALPVEHKAYDVQDALAQLDALQKPEGVKDAVWDELKTALKSALSTNYHLPTTKIASTPPTGPANRVNDLTATRETNGDFTLSWHYRNIGDYDQNGTVGVTDITPLAMHYGEAYDKNTVPDCIQAVIDGSGNGKISIEDITQIAMYFGSEFARYSMQGGDQQQGPFAQTTAEQLPAEGRGDARLAFAFNLGDQPAYSYWRVVPMDGEGGTGDASNVAVLNVEAPVRVLGVTPLSGLAGAEVTFTAFVTGTGPFAYEWDFGTGATPNTSTDAQPIVMLNNDAVATQYSAHVKVTGATGSVTYPFTLTVTPTPGNPPVINSVGPFAGLSGDSLSFNADVTGDEPLTYSWEFDGGASPPVSVEVSPTVILSRGGTLPAPAKDYPCRLTVTNASGSASSDFTLTVSAQWHFLDQPFEISKAGITPDGSVWVIQRTATDLLYSVWNGQNWEHESILRAGYGYLAFGPLDNEPGALAVEGNGLTGHVMYIHRNQGQWLSEDVAFNEGWVGSASCSLAYRANGSPVAAWAVVGTPFKVRIAQRAGAEWRIDTLPAPEDGAASPKVFIDGSGEAAIMFSSQTSPESVWIAREEGAGWQIQQALSNAQMAKLAQKADRTPGIIAVDNVDNLYYSENIAESWARNDICPKPADMTIYTAGLAYLPGDIPLVAFEETQTISQTEQIRNFFFAWLDGPSWTILPLNDSWTSAYWAFYYVGLTPDGTTVIGGVIEKSSSVGSLVFYW